MKNIIIIWGSVVLVSLISGQTVKVGGHTRIGGLIGAGGGFSQASIFSNGTKVLRAVECAHGTVSYTSLTAAAANQEITIQTGIPVTARWEQITISETTQFTGTTGLTVSMGRPGSGNYELTGTLVPLMVSAGDTNFWTSRPSPPLLAGSAYDVVLNFAVTAGNVNAATAGTLTYEMCGYEGR